MSENLNLKTITTIDPSPFKHLCVTIGELPSTFVESMSYYELLAWFVNYLENTVIPAVNANGEATAELQELFVELKTFVDTYFDNLDVQDEINHKLDEMVEDGTLDTIINKNLFENVLPLKVKPEVKRLGRYLIPYGTDILSSESAVTNFNLQGGCLTTLNNMIIALMSQAQDSVTLREFNFNTGAIQREVTSSILGHCNDIHKIGDYVYVATYESNTGTTIKKLDYATLSLQNTYDLGFPVKSICQDEITGKCYVCNNTSVYEWEKDTTNTTKLFDFDIPDFVIETDGITQGICVYNNMIYLLGCYNQTNNVVIFILDMDGNLYNTWDLGDHNADIYYGEAQMLKNRGHEFFMTSVFRCGSTFYNDYQIDNVFTFNPFEQVKNNPTVTALTTNTYRQIKSNVDSYVVDGTATHPYKYYFEFLLEEQIHNINLHGNISGGDQPFMRITNQRARFNVDGVNIEGMFFNNSEVLIVGSNGATVNSKRQASHAEIQATYAGKLTLRDMIIGNSVNNLNDYGVYLGSGCELQYTGCTIYPNIPVYNNGGIVQKTSDISKLATQNSGRCDPQIFYYPRQGFNTTTHTYEFTVTNAANNILTTSDRKYIQVNYRFGNNEFACSADVQSLSGWSFARQFVIKGQNVYDIYFVTATAAYDSTNKKFTFTVNSIKDSTGTDASFDLLGYSAVGMLIIM